MHLFSNSCPAVNEIGDINKITQMGENLFYIIRDILLSGRFFSTKQRPLKFKDNKRKLNSWCANWMQIHEYSWSRFLSLDILNHKTFFNKDLAFERHIPCIGQINAYEETVD